MMTKGHWDGRYLNITDITRKCYQLRNYLLNLFRNQLAGCAAETNGVARLENQTVFKCLKMAIRLCLSSK